MANKKDKPLSGKVSIRGDKELAKDINDVTPKRYIAPNPIRTQIKLNQFPWTEKQKEFFRVALHPDTKIVFVDGPAGTAKTLLSVYCSLQLLNMKMINTIMYLRSAVESSANSLGFLPGAAEDKLKFYNLPFIDKLDELLMTTKPERLEEQGRISMFPVNFARGMNWEAKCIILDEAQNSSAKEIITVLTRLGNGSRAFVLADPMQTDLKNPNHIGGFENLSSAFADEASLQMGVYRFQFNEDDIMRSELVKFLVKKFNGLDNYS
jgi:phosphate starvation-inducible PhoH-like protein